MSNRNTASIRAVSRWLSLGLLIASLSAISVAQSEPAPPPPPPPGGPGMMTMQGPGFGGGFFHEEIGEGRQVVTGAPMTAVIDTTRDTTLSDGNTIHTDNQSTVYRDSQGRVRREIQFELATPATGATKRTMIVITDPVSGNRYMLNPQNKTAHLMPLHPPKPPNGSREGERGERGPGPENANVTTESLGTKVILGLQAQGTRVTRTIPAGQIGNAKAISVVTDRWVSTEVQIPISMTHSDPMMGTVTSNVTSVTRAEPDASLFQVPSDYKIETGKPGDMMYMPAHPLN
jgi:hypothetical protein